MKKKYNGVEVTYQNETDYNQSNVVYLITFPDGKYYVGSTCRLGMRISTHCCVSMKTNKQIPICDAVRYFMKFNVTVLRSEPDKFKLRELEKYYTIEYNSTNAAYGYNISVGISHSCETILKISKSKKGINNSRTMSDETLIKLSEKNGTKISDDHGNIFRSAYHAAEFYNCSPSTVHSNLVKGSYSKKLGTMFHYLTP